MKIKNIARSLHPFVVGVSLFVASSFLLVGSAYAADFSASFSPAAEAVEQDATVNITISFDRAIYVDTDDAVFAADTLGDVVSLHRTNASGAAIPFDASISADNMVITVDPTGDLPNGAVYVAISNSYYDADDMQGDAASAIFFIASASEAPESAPDTTVAPEVAPTPEAPESAPVADTPDAPAPEAAAPEGPESTPDANAPETAPAPESPNENAPEAAVAPESPGSGPTIDADTTAPTATISPADGTTVTDNTQNVTITFSEAVSKDADGMAFADADLAGILTVKSTDASGADIAYTATINTDSTAITIDPTSDLADGVVYVAISDGYYDAAGNQGSAANVSFTVAVPDTTAPTVTISPADGTTVTDNTQNVVITLSEAVYMDASAGAFDGTSLAAVLSLKSTDVNGTDIAYTATIDTDNDEITIDPTADLADGVVYVAISDGYYDAAGNQGSAVNVSFTVAVPDTTAPTVTISPADGATVTDNTEDITLTFSEAVSKDADGMAFADADLAGILTVKSTDADGADIAYTATIDTDNDEITIDPTADLADGVVYVAISDGYYDAAGNQGSAANVSFTVAVPEEFVVTSSPEKGATVGDSATDISLIFNRPVYRDRNGTVFTTKDLASFVVLRTDDAYGYAIPFEAQMDSTNTVITIYPTDPLVDGDVYVAISGDYYDADENRGVAFKSTFTVDTGTPPVVEDFFSQFLSLSPVAMSKVSLGAPTLPVEFDEELRKEKILETVTLLWQALESLSIVAAMDSADTAASDGSASDQPSTVNAADAGASEAGASDQSSTANNGDESGEVGPDAVLPEQSPAAE